MLWFVTIVALLILAFAILRARHPAPVEENRMLSVVLMLSRPRALTRSQAAEAAARAFGANFDSASPDAEYAVIQADPGKFAVKLPSLTLGLINASEPYVPEPGDAAAAIADFAFSQVVRRHTAWLAIDLIGALPPDGERAAYRAIGHMAAELVDGADTLGLYCTTLARGVAFSDELPEQLRSDDPLAAFTAEREDQTVTLNEDDPRIRAAEDEARQRLGEFLDAFAHRRHGQHFAVKVPFETPSGAHEFMWIDVSAIDQETARGMLANDPKDIPSLKLGAPVTAPLGKVCDWLYTDGRNTFGSFTARAMGMEQ